MEIAKRDVDTELRLGKPRSGGASAAAEKWVKVRMQGVPYQRKVDLRAYRGHGELRAALAALFRFVGTSDLAGQLDFTLVYEDEDGDLLLAGDLPWDMFVSKCKRLSCPSVFNSMVRVRVKH